MSGGLKEQVTNELDDMREQLEKLRKLEAQLELVEEACQKERDRAQLYLDIAGVLILAIDSAQKVVVANKKCCEILGYEEHEIVGKNWFENFVPERKREEVKDTFAKLLAGEMEPVEYFENPVLTKTDEERIIAWHSTVLKDQAGKIVGTLSSGEDITERKSAEEALHKGEEKNRLFMQNMPGIAFLADLDFVPVFVRGAAEELTGYCEEDFKAGKPRWDQIIHPDDVRGVQENTKKLASVPGSSIECEHRIVRKDGTVRWLQMTVKNLCDDLGKPFMVQGVGHDITRRKLVELALYESEKRYQTIFDSGNDGVFIHDVPRTGMPSRFIEVNDVACKMLGYTKEELLRLSPKDITAGKGHYDPEMMRELCKHEDALFEMILVAKDGRKICIEVNAHQIDLAGQKVMLTVARDISERKRTEEALRESEERFRSLFDNVAVGVSLVDKNGMVLTANKADCDFLDYSEKELIGRHFREFTYLQDLTKSLALHNSLLKGERKNYVIDKRYVRKDGKVVWGRASVSLIKDDHGTPQYAAVVREDITQQKKAEKNLKGSYLKLRKALEGTVNTLAAIVEMRDPYTAGHQRRVAQLACAIAVEMGLSNKQVEVIDIAGRLHDIGKVSVPTEILSKPSGINEFEFEIIKGHPRVGHDILKQIQFDQPVIQIIMQHHERMDGSSYPKGLAGDEILLEARIIAVADVVEAMSSHRPYRPALGIEKALEEIEKNKGTLYDAGVADACLRLFRDKGFRFY